MGQTRYSCVFPSELFLGTSRHHFPASGRPNAATGNWSLSDGAQYASTQERFATSPFVVVRKFMRIAVCLKSIQ